MQNLFNSELTLFTLALVFMWSTGLERIEVNINLTNVLFLPLQMKSPNYDIIESMDWDEEILLVPTCTITKSTEIKSTFRNDINSVRWPMVAPEKDWVVHPSIPLTYLHIAAETMVALFSKKIPVRIITKHQKDVPSSFLLLQSYRPMKILNISCKHRFSHPL